ncbi:MAG TPA: tripartite tricarboxylate transporter substrate-binding protein, partial [Xanthobacteraceae bacterium]|nr:tripartite tricarboxylate transporter substrate-binding protein [Xanthobacteraceae bacterium]
MKVRRRRFLQLVTAATAAPALPRAASALDYPTRPVKILSGFSAGGAVDIVSRLMAQWLTDHFKSQFIVEDRPGAANNIATEDMIKSPPDGYMLLLTNPTNVINATLYPHLKFNFLRDSDPVAGIMRVPNVMEVGAQVPAKTIAEFIAYAKA